MRDSINSKFHSGDKVDFKPKLLGKDSFFLPGIVKDMNDGQIFIEFTYDNKVYMENTENNCEYLKECGRMILSRTDCWFIFFLIYKNLVYYKLWISKTR